MYLDYETKELTVEDRLKVVSVVAARSPRVRSSLPPGLRTDHSLVDLRPLRDDEAAIEVPTTRHTNMSPTP